MPQNLFPKGYSKILTMTFPIPYIPYHESPRVMVSFVRDVNKNPEMKNKLVWIFT